MRPGRAARRALCGPGGGALGGSARELSAIVFSDTREYSILTSMLGCVNDVNDETAPGGVSPRTQPPVRVRRPGRAAVRRRLLDAALEVFAERGYASANLDQVAAAAGLTKGAIYSNFASKDDLFFAMMHDQANRRVEAVRVALEAGEGAPGGEQSLHDIGRLLTAAFTEQRAWQLVLLPVNPWVYRCRAV